MADVWYVVSTTSGTDQVLAVPQGSPEQSTLESGQKSGGYTKIAGPYPTQTDAATALAAVGASAGIGNATKNSGITSAVAGPLSGIAAVGDFFSRLTQANAWIRIGEVLIGILLITVGIASITGAAGAIPKVIPV